jgi:hypothetical protein
MLAQHIDAVPIGVSVHESGAQRVRLYGVEEQASATEGAAIKQR